LSDAGRSAAAPVRRARRAMCGRTARAGVLRGQRLVGYARPCHRVAVRQSCVDAVESCDLSLREVTSCPCKKEDIVEDMDGRRERGPMTAASAAYLNKGMQATALGPAHRRGHHFKAARQADRPVYHAASQGDKP